MKIVDNTQREVIIFEILTETSPKIIQLFEALIKTRGHPRDSPSFKLESWRRRNSFMIG